MYLTYGEYAEIGGVLDSTAFNRNIDRALGMVNNATYNRIKCMAKVPSQVKALCRDLVEYIATNANVAEKDVASWSEGAGVVTESVSYVQKSNEDMQKDIDGIIFDYLGSVVNDNGVPLLYKGAMC
jgi:hypothetical protein